MVHELFDVEGFYDGVDVEGGREVEGVGFVNLEAFFAQRDDGAAYAVVGGVDDGEPSAIDSGGVVFSYDGADNGDVGIGAGVICPAPGAITHAVVVRKVLWVYRVAAGGLSTGSGGINFSVEC